MVIDTYNQMIPVVYFGAFVVSFSLFLKKNGRTENKVTKFEDLIYSKDLFNINCLEVYDIRRKVAIFNGKATDHAGEVVYKINNNFQLDQTIFKTVDNSFSRLVLSSKLGLNLFWSEKSLKQHNLSMKFIAPPLHDQDLINFMKNECDFIVEHADGSFMDHLIFCFQYGAAHFKDYSPRVLLLHSILGVGTNLFPMKLSKLNVLKSMCSDFEICHIQAFPSIFRLILEGTFLDHLKQYNREKLLKLKKIIFHRVIDNHVISLSLKDIWIQLNYQLIHLLDFIPISNWLNNIHEKEFHSFITLYNFLFHNNLLLTKLDFNLVDEGVGGPSDLPFTLGRFLFNLMPALQKKKFNANSVRNFSKKIGHSLNYTLEWAE